MATPIVVLLAHIGMGTGAAIRGIVSARILVNASCFAIPVAILSRLYFIITTGCRAITVLV